jgi:hypothetical protein
MSDTVTVYVQRDSSPGYREIETESEVEDRFSDMLNETHERVSICGYDYDPARALKEIDPVAFRQELLNWLDENYYELEMPWEMYVDREQDPQTVSDWVENEINKL